MLRISSLSTQRSLGRPQPYSILCRAEFCIDAPISSPELRVLRSSAPPRFKLSAALCGLELDIIALAKKSLRVMDSLLQSLRIPHVRGLSKTASILMNFKWFNRKVSASRFMLEPLRTHSCGTAKKLLLGFLGCRILRSLSLAVWGGGLAITMPST